MLRTCSRQSLEGVDDPETKRKIIAAPSLNVFDEEAAKDRRRGFPGPGDASNPDVIESVTRLAARARPSSPTTM